MTEDILKGADFIDMGASTGGSLEWASRAFGGVGLGVDISADKAEQARKLGRNVLVADARSINLPDDSVRFVTMMDFLEHLPNLDIARDIISSACRLARDFVYIAFPNFDNEQILRKLKLKRYYTDWSGHTLHLRSEELRSIFIELGVNADLYFFNELFDSSDRNILPISSKINSQSYDPSIHEAKPFHIFPRKKIYTRTIALARINSGLNSNEIMMNSMVSLGYLRKI